MSMAADLHCRCSLFERIASGTSRGARVVLRGVGFSVGRLRSKRTFPAEGRGRACGARDLINAGRGEGSRRDGFASARTRAGRVRAKRQDAVLGKNTVAGTDARH